MRRAFPLSAAAGLTLTLVGCAPGKAEIEIVDADGDGLDDDFGWGDGDGDGGDDGGDDAPDTPGEDPDEPDDEPDEDPAGDSLAGDWDLVGFDGYDMEYSYEGEQCTYTDSFDLAMSFAAEGGGEYDGQMFVEYTWTMSGDECPYAGESYSGTERYNATGESLGDRTYQIRIRDWDLRTRCELSGDRLDCDIGMRFERE